MTPPVYTTCLLDVDGVLAEVSKSYRAAIVSTCHKYGATSINEEVIGDWKAKGGANNDWKLSLDLINSDPNGQKDLSLDQVTETFEEFYQGTEGQPGLCDLESLIPSRATLEELRKRSKVLALVTGRPKKDCEKFIKQNSLESLIDTYVCMEDGPPKPDPFPVLEACKKLGIQPSPSVILVGDTPDDIRAANAAGCKGVGVATPEAAAEQVKQGKSFDSTQLCLAMKECGAELILEPGFEKLLDYFPVN
ncbi:MAG: hypothetical protein SGBAC_000982 [Bacillariaceae sp.]